MEWKELAGNWVLIPDRPLAIIHFLGGAFVATAPQVTYRLLLETMANNGFGIIATPFINTLDHEAIAQSVLVNFERGWQRLEAGLLKRRYVPIYGMGHSMGSKLHLLIGSLWQVERSGNILISYNNFSARRSIPFVEQFPTAFSVEFTPSPAQTDRLIQLNYQVRRNLLIQFRNDEIDQTPSLQTILNGRFPDMVSFCRLPGNHLTPLGQDIKWQVGDSYSPIDAIGQFLKQEVFRDLGYLEKEILRWLDPFAFH